MTNTPGGKKRIKETYGDRILIVPYVMPGFILAKKIHEMTRGIDWGSIDGMILLNHGVFTFHDDPKVSYENMIDIVGKAENYLKQNKAKPIKIQKRKKPVYLEIAQLREQISEIWGKPILCRLNQSGGSVAFSQLPNVKSITNRGPLTPDHIIRTKRTPLVLSDNFEKDLEKYKTSYEKYFQKYNTGQQVQLDTAPRWAIWPGRGSIAFGLNLKAINIIEDITRHTVKRFFKQNN